MLCFVVLDDGLIVSNVLDVGNTNAHGPKSKNADGEKDATDENRTHPDAVFDVGFATAHSSAPFVSAVQSFSLRLGPSWL